MNHFLQNLQSSAREKNILDHMYSNIKQAYKTVPVPHQGLSDHLSLPLLLAYISRRKTSKTAITWPEGALSQLQDCFESTEWSTFDYFDLREFYIKSYTDNMTVDKCFLVSSNQKSWITLDDQTLLKKQN